MTTSAAISRSDPAAAPGPCLQRSQGDVRLTVRADRGPTRISVLHQSGCGKLRLPKVEGDTPEAVLINMAGGLTGGDRFSADLELGPGAALTVTTQACEKIYRSAGDVAQVTNRIAVGADAACSWLPQETILFDGARLTRSLEADLAGGARLLACEAVIFGRQARGEIIEEGAFHDRWRIRRGGRLMFSDDTRLQGPIADILERPAVALGARAMATVVHVAEDAERHLTAVRAALPDMGGASTWDGRLVVRLLAGSHRALRERLRLVLGILRDGAPLPKVWSL